MNGCEDQLERLMLYLDGELDDRESLERHLADCAGCSSFIERHQVLERLIQIPVPESERFLADVKARISSESRPVPVRKLWIAAAAAAVLLLLIWGFRKPEPLVIEEERQIVLETDDPSLGEEDRFTARAELGAILADLAEAPGDALVSLFEERTRSLREGGWRVENMVAATLKREVGPARLGAVRLVGASPRYRDFPVVTTYLGQLLKNPEYAGESLQALAFIGGRRAESLIGKTLLDEVLRDRALAALVGMEEGGQAKWIAASVLKTEEIIEGPLSPYAETAVRTLAAMEAGSSGAMLDLYAASDANPEFVQVLVTADRVWIGDLLASLEDLHGISRRRALTLAATLRSEEVLDLLYPRSGDPPSNREIPHLVALVGGPAAVFKLLNMYGAPLSMKERENVAHALARIFAFYPDEMAATLTVGLDPLSEDGRDTLIEMLGKAGGDGGCRALAWMVKHRPDLTSAAALTLARTGSEQALDRLMDLLMNNGLSPGAEVCAVAAAYHLGGKAVLQALNTREAAPVHAKKMKRGSLTDARFEKLKRYITEYPNF